MDYQYKVIISNRTVYKEFEIPTDMEGVRLGTTSFCEFRLNPESFFGDIEIEFTELDNKWNIDCSDNVYFSRGDMRKLYSTEIKHGDIISVCYTNTGNEAFELRFMIDFDAKVPNYNWYVKLPQTITIATEEGADIVLHSQFGEKSKVVIRQDSSGYVLSEIMSTFGVLKNAIKIDEKVILNDSDFISIDGFQFYYKKGKLYFDKENIRINKISVFEIFHQNNEFEYPLFNRKTRVKKKFENTKLTILDPPAEPTKPQNNIVMNLLPAVGMIALTVLVRGVMSNGSSSFVLFSVCSMGMGIVTSVLGFVNGNKQYKLDSEKRVKEYTSYIENKKEQIELTRTNELETMQSMFYDTSLDTKIVDTFDERLFERLPEDEDFLVTYLGKGKIKAKQQIINKEKESFETSDDLNQIPGQIAAEYEYIDDAPITLEIKNANAIGIIGESNSTYELCKNMILDIAIRQYYGDVKIFLLLSECDNRFEWIKFLPHIQNDFGRRNVVTDVDSKNNIFEYLFKELTMREELKNQKDAEIGIHLVVFVFDEHGIKNHPVSKFISEAASLNVTFIFVERREENIPLYCSKIIKTDAENKAYIFGSEDASDKQLFEIENISDSKAVPSYIGQGNHLFTTSQLARYATALATSGTVYDLSLLNKVTDSQGKILNEYAPSVKNEMSDEPNNVWEDIHDGMRRVVQTHEQFNGLGVTLSGKTGTAELDIYHPNHGLFIGYTNSPSTGDAEYAIAVRIANGYTSGNACLTANDILQYIYDLADEDTILTGYASSDTSNTSND